MKDYPILENRFFPVANARHTFGDWKKTGLFGELSERPRA
jgi:hypothetical protein